METEKTLLQQIRDKEQEFAKKIESARADADAVVTAAKTEAEELLCTANEEAKMSAEQVYWTVRGKTETEIETLNNNAGKDLAVMLERAKNNLPAAAEKIVRYVTME